MPELPEQVNTVLRRLRDAGCAAYAVGGCVRDRLMGMTPKDYDVATAALPAQTAAVFAGEKLIETGMKHGTVTVLLRGMPIEITTFRVDGSYTDARHPDAVAFTPSLTEDLARRDFTVNAMALGEDGAVIDPFGGEADLAAGVIRCVGDPDERFKEDALRILRALRFASVLGFAVEGETADALRRNRERLKRISAERVAEELCKLICGRDVKRVLLTYAETLGAVLPELLPMRGFDQRNRHHIYDVLEHTAVAMEHVPPEPVLRWAALLHDSGKPACFTLDAKGEGHFYGHPKESARIADAALRRLRLDTATREQAVLLVQYHDTQIEPTEKAVRRALNKYGPEALFRLLMLKRADNLAQSPEYRERLAQCDAVERLARDILARKDCFSRKDLAVRGGDLIAAGVAPGPALGAALQTLLDAVIDGRAENERDALLRFWKENKE